jgi:hypothetical protein
VRTRVNFIGSPQTLKGAMESDLNKLKTDPKIWSFDIDGILNYYPKVWLDFIYNKTGICYTSKELAKEKLVGEYHRLKHEYRESDYKYSVQVVPEAKKLISSLKKKGKRVIIATNRPFERYRFMKSKTKMWLNANGLEYDELISKKELNGDNFDAHIDDKLSDILEVKNRSKDKYYILYGPNEGNVPVSVPLLEGVTVVKSLTVLE